MANGRQKGCKKILVLYTNFGKHRKPEKTNWVMHQYHLGQLEEEKEGELVVSKIFYQTQPRQCSWTADKGVAITADAMEHVRDNGSASSSSKEAVNQRDEMSSGGGISGYSAAGVQQMNSDSFSFSPFEKSFDQVTTAGECENLASAFMQACRDQFPSKRSHSFYLQHEKDRKIFQTQNKLLVGNRFDMLSALSNLLHFLYHLEIRFSLPLFISE